MKISPKPVMPTGTQRGFQPRRQFANASLLQALGDFAAREVDVGAVTSKTAVTCDSTVARRIERV